MSGGDATSFANMASKRGTKHAPIPNRAVEGSNAIPVWLLKRSGLVCIALVSAVHNSEKKNMYMSSLKDGPYLEFDF